MLCMESAQSIFEVANAVRHLYDFLVEPLGICKDVSNTHSQIKNEEIEEK